MCPGPPPQAAAQTTTALRGLEPSDEQLKVGSLAFHYAWSPRDPLNQLLRRKTKLGPIAAALATGGR